MAEHRSRFVRSDPIAWIALALVFAVAVPAAYRWGWLTGVDGVRRTAEHQLALYEASLRSELAQYEYLPAFVALNTEVVALLREPRNARLSAAVNGYLEQANAPAGTAAIYVLGLDGVVLAASNWNERISFVGIDLAYRPYFADALQGRSGRFFGIGTTSGEPGYYFSVGIRDTQQLLGVAAVKVNLDKLEAAWGKAGDDVFVTDADRVIVLSTVPDWKFKTLAPLAADVLERIRATRQYDHVSLQPIDLATEAQLNGGSRIVLLPDNGTVRRMLATSLAMPDTAWQITVLSDLAAPLGHARDVAIIAALAATLLATTVLYLRQRQRAIVQRLAAKEALQRAYDELERKVIGRTADLLAANERLQGEIAERLGAEHVLREAQDALVQANKMAVLGQMASGITHELNQPLAALRTLSDNTREFLKRSQLADAERNLDMICKLCDRMGRITAELKSYGRTSTAELVGVDVGRAVANAVFLVEHRLRSEGIELVQEFAGRELHALCNGNRLEQVLINLLANAIDAMKGRPVRRLTIAARDHGERIVIKVRDTGPGVGLDTAARLFEPFFTTKAAGAGLGLGLAISAGIVRDFRGTLTAANHPEGGAEFTLELLTATEAALG